MTHPLVRGELHVGLVLLLCPKTFASRAVSISQKSWERPFTAHPFICLAVDGNESTWTPVTSADGDGRIQLISDDRRGHRWWTDQTKKSYIIPGALWRIDLEGLNLAMVFGNDISCRMHRNHYLIHPRSVENLLKPQSPS